MRKDTLQGLLRYPAPVYHRAHARGSRKKDQKFFQFISAPKPAHRLSRRRLAPPGQPPAVREENWRRLRLNKNL